MMTAKKLIRSGSIILLFMVIVGYGLWRSRDLLFGIRMSVSGISDGMTATDPLLALSGIARRANGVTVDGMAAPIDQKGAWQDTVVLLPGYNAITISATDTFGRVTTDRYRIYYKAPPPNENPPPAPLPSLAPASAQTPAAGQ